MGLMDALQSGIGQAAEGLAASSMEQIRAQIDQDRQAALMQMKAQTELEMAPKIEEARIGVQTKAADEQRQKVGGLMSAAKEGIDIKDERSILGSQINALRDQGYMKEADAMQNRLDKLDDNTLNKDYKEWQMKHGDEQLQMSRDQMNANIKMEKQRIGMAAEKLNLDKAEKKEAKSAIDAYAIASGNFDSLNPASTDAATYKAAKVAKETAAIKLMQYGIKVGGDTSQVGRFQPKVTKGETGEETLQVVDTSTGKVEGGKPQSAGKDRAAQFKVIR